MTNAVSGDAPIDEDVTCEHGVAMDVHCCGCHSGFLFDRQKCTCLNPPDDPKRIRVSIGDGLTYLECPCCGDDGAASDGEGSFRDGQTLICGCPGLVSVDEDGEAWINNGDAVCEKCHG